MSHALVTLGPWSSIDLKLCPQLTTCSNATCHAGLHSQVDMAIWKAYKRCLSRDTLWQAFLQDCWIFGLNLLETYSSKRGSCHATPTAWQFRDLSKGWWVYVTPSKVVKVTSKGIKRYIIYMYNKVTTWITWNLCLHNVQQHRNQRCRQLLPRLPFFWFRQKKVPVLLTPQMGSHGEHVSVSDIRSNSLTGL